MESKKTKRWVQVKREGQRNEIVLIDNDLDKNGREELKQIEIAEKKYRKKYGHEFPGKKSTDVEMKDFFALFFRKKRFGLQYGSRDYPKWDRFDDTVCYPDCRMNVECPEHGMRRGVLDDRENVVCPECNRLRVNGEEE